MVLLPASYLLEIKKKADIINIVKRLDDSIKTDDGIQVSLMLKKEFKKHEIEFIPYCCFSCNLTSALMDREKGKEKLIFEGKKLKVYLEEGSSMGDLIWIVMKHKDWEETLGLI